MLSTSPLLQKESPALDSLLQLFKEMVVSEAIAYPDLLAMLQKRLTTNSTSMALSPTTTSATGGGGIIIIIITPINSSFYNILP